MITTCRPRAEIAGSPAGPTPPSALALPGLPTPVTALFASGRYSIAWWDARHGDPWHLQPARHPGAAGQHDGAVVDAQIGCGDVGASIDAALERRALGADLIESAVQPPLLEQYATEPVQRSRN